MSAESIATTRVEAKPYPAAGSYPEVVGAMAVTATARPEWATYYEGAALREAGELPTAY